jgi:T-complex protein 1 subunit gamma
MHPIIIIGAYKKALEDALQILNDISIPVNINEKTEMLKLIKASIGTKMVSSWSDLMCNLAYEAVKCVSIEKNGKKEIDIKRYARVEKVFTLSPMFFTDLLTLRYQEEP